MKPLQFHTLRSFQRHPSVALSLLALTALAAAGCSEGDTVTATTGCDGFLNADGTQVANGSTGGCEGLCRVTNDDFCGAMAAPLSCDSLSPGAKIDLCGVPLPSPPGTPTGSGGKLVDELKRSSGVKEYAGSGPVDIACMLPGGYPEPPDTANSQLVTVEGIAKIFSNGCQSRDLEIAFYTVKRTGGADDGEPDQLIGATVTTAADCTIDGVAEEGIEDCTPTRYECRYSYPNVPTETELMIYTDGAIWAPIYEYNVFIPNSEVSGGAWEKDVRALAEDDYGVIPQAAMGKNMAPGKGAVAGEVHDCGNIRVMNAVVDVNKSRFITTYYTDDEDSPLPDTGVQGTSTLGLYSAFDISPGPVTVAAAGVLDGKLVGIGYFQARVFPDAVSSVTFRGLKPFQVE